jgi:uncharacterized membrane protein HdeD (DUF308 family)
MALHGFGRSWWLVLLRGIFAILFGLVAFLWPGLTLVALVLLYGIYAMADGAVALYAALAGGGPVSRWWLLFAGMLGLAVGIVTLAWPGITALALLVCIAVWALVRGVFEIVSAIQLRKVIDNEWWLVGSGVLSVLFGVVVLMAPGAGAIALVWVIGAYSIAVGCLLIGLAFRLKNFEAIVVR